jgi:hypothetical protein
MTDLDRTKVTFKQAEGLEPLPSQLKPKELSDALRAGLWAVVNEHLAGARQYSEYGKDTIREPWRSILFDMHVWRDYLPADEFHGYSVDAYAKLKPIFLRGSYSDVFDSLQWILRRPGCPRVFSRQISMVLETCRAGYRLTEDGKTFMPIASEEDAEVARRAFAALNTNPYAGARKHLVTAAERLTAGDAPGGVREQADQKMPEEFSLSISSDIPANVDATATVYLATDLYRPRAGWS